MTTYEETGVNIDKSNQFVNLIKERGISTGFAAMFNVPKSKNLAIVASTDGVGTKVQLAHNEENFKNLGIDLVAAVFNDIATHGATPAFMLDYYGVPKLYIHKGTIILDGIQEGLQKCNAILLGGETAEMPTVYQPNAFDLVGFGVGFVDLDLKANTLPVTEGDVIIGINSSGPHANGFSLIRPIIQYLDTYERLNELLAPSHIYWPCVKELIRTVKVKSMANITGGGLLENIPRVIPLTHTAVLEAKSWEWPDVFKWIQRAGNVPIDEMYKVFNLGIGYVVIVSEDDETKTHETIIETGFIPTTIGCVVPAGIHTERCVIA